MIPLPFTKEGEHVLKRPQKRRINDAPLYCITLLSYCLLDLLLYVEFPA
jgi:hypothetical protein